ncbi:MAG: DUF881 domain-containing protein [Proteocatella sp.]
MKPEITKRINILLLITFVFGICLSIQLKTLSDKAAFINIEGVNEMEMQVKIESAEISNLSDYLNRKKNELSEYKIDGNSSDVIEIIEAQIENYKKINAEYNLAGSGVVVEIRDSDKPIRPGENPNDFLVHDQDILRIVNDLKISGAEAISINGQRYMGFSEIKCSGATVTVNGKTYGQPFIIKAIGNPTDLEAAIKSIDSYSYILNNIYGIKINVKTPDKVEIPKYGKIKQYDYLKESMEDSE